MRAYGRAAVAIGYAEAAEVPLPPEARARIARALDGEWTLESLRRLGRYEGVRAQVQHRRQGLETKYHHRLAPVLTAALRHIAPGVARKLAPHESTESDDAMSAIEAALNDLPAELRDEWTAVIRDALQEAVVEGRIDAQAYAAVARGLPVPSFDISFQQAIDAMRDLPSLPLGDWIEQSIHGLAYDLGQQLADLMQNGATYSDLTQAIMDGAADVDGNGAAFILDHALAGACVDGSLALYTAEGLEQVDLLTADDPDEECSDLAQQGPYGVNDAPAVPVHYGCRCDLVPHLGQL